MRSPAAGGWAAGGVGGMGSGAAAAAAVVEVGPRHRMGIFVFCVFFCICVPGTE